MSVAHLPIIVQQVVLGFIIDSFTDARERYLYYRLLPQEIQDQLTYPKLQAVNIRISYKPNQLQTGNTRWADIYMWVSSGNKLSQICWRHTTINHRTTYSIIHTTYDDNDGHRSQIKYETGYDNEIYARVWD
jgi:hypothetical protein